MAIKSTMLDSALEKAWYGQARWLTLLLPLMWLFQSLSFLRRLFIKPDNSLAVPVIIVGNINVGGTGKTPLLMALVAYLLQQHYKVGVISRGYGGNSTSYPLSINDKTHAHECGDEPLMIYQRCQVPVVVDPDRARAAQALVAEHGCNVIVSDDGLQHYRLKRDIELVVVDSARGLGNGYCLPVGPLRESASRLDQVDMIVINGDDTVEIDSNTARVTMQLVPQRWVNCKTDEVKTLEDFQKQFAEKNLHAIAGIGNPDRFFTSLTDQQYRIQSHPFPDHYCYSQNDFNFGEGAVVVMTEKDKVKCQAFAIDSMWYLEVGSVLPDTFFEKIHQRLNQVEKNSE